MTSKQSSNLPKLSDLTPRLLRALDAAESLLDHDDPNIRLKAISAVSSIVSTYAKLPSNARRGPNQSFEDNLKEMFS